MASAQPRVPECFLRAEPLTWVDFEQLENKVLGLIGNEAPVRVVEGELAGEDGTELARVVLVLEGLVASEDGVNNDTDAPHISLEAVAGTRCLQQLWCGVLEGSTGPGDPGRKK